LMGKSSMRNKIILTIIFLLLSVSVLADTPLGIASLNQIPSEGSKAFNNIQGQFEHPQICPLDKNIISFELRTELGIKLYWYHILYDSLVEINPPATKTERSDIFKEFGMTLKKATPDNYDLDWCPIISPYGEIICAYTHTSGVNQDVYLYYLFENKHVLLTGIDHKDRKFKDANPRWSPDGSMITFQSDRSGENNIHLFTGMDKFLSFPIKYSPIMYNIPGKNKIEGFVVSWNPQAPTGILAFTESMNAGHSDYYHTSSLISLPDSQSSWMMIDADKKNMISPSWDPFYGDRIAFYSYQWDADELKNKSKKYNINIRRVFKDNQGKLSVNSISNAALNDAPVIVDDYHGPLWLANSKYILYLQLNSDGTTSLHYGDLSYWANGQKPWNRPLLSSDKYKNIRHLSLEKQQIAFISNVNDSSYIIIGRLTGEGAVPPEKPDYKLKRHPRYAEFVNQIGQRSKDSFLKKLTLKPIGGKDLIINRPIVGMGIGALLILLSNGGDEGPVSGNIWDDLPDLPNPDN